MPPESHLGSTGQKVSQVHMAGYQVTAHVAPLPRPATHDPDSSRPLTFSLGFDVSDSTFGWEPVGHLPVREYDICSFFIVFIAQSICCIIRTPRGVWLYNANRKCLLFLSSPPKSVQKGHSWECQLRGKLLYLGLLCTACM